MFLFSFDAAVVASWPIVCAATSQGIRLWESLCAAVQLHCRKKESVADVRHANPEEVKNVTLFHIARM